MTKDRTAIHLAVFIFVVFLLVYLMARSVFGSPFLVCDDPTEGGTPTCYHLEGLGAEVVETEAPLHHDVESLADGVHTVRARACNWRGCSDWSDPYTFTLEPAPSGKPSTPTLEP